MSLFLHAGNDLTHLAESLRNVIAELKRGPLKRIQVVVPTPETGRWLELWLAERDGICANIDLILPQKFIHSLMDSLLGHFENGEKFTKNAMSWWLWARLRDLPDNPMYLPLRGYLDNDPDGRATFALARQLATLFDRYMVYRPELMSGKMSPSTHAWQWGLWQACVSESGGKNPSGRHFELIKRLQDEVVKLDSELPVLFFGHDTLAPSYMETLRALARHKEVRIFAWQPTREIWDDLLPVRDQLSAAHKSGVVGAALHFDRGQSLLVGCGKIGRDYFKLLRGEENDIAGDGDHFWEPESGTALASLQRAVLSAVPTGNREKVSLADKSVQIHSCHNPIREVEVLHDFLLECFEEVPELTSRDVLVLAPDIELYAPLIHAVFETEDAKGEHSRRIRVAVADRSAKHLSPLLGNILSLLKRRDWMLPVSEVMALLEMPAVRRRFDLDEEEVVRLRVWCERAGVAWGWDASHRKRLGLPAEAQNTWRWALDRLLLGSMMAVEPCRLIDGMAPAADVRGDTIRAVGKLESLVATLHEFSLGLSEERTLSAWSHWLSQMLDRLLKPDRDETEELRPIQIGIGRLSEWERLVGVLGQMPVPAEVVYAYLESVTGPRAGGNYLGGPVTCCSLKPMRNVPAKVICLLGMNDGDFPRRDSPLPFDWMMEQPRDGDRTARDEDRYLFLQSVMAARERFFVSYIGHSESDERERAPSVLVSELMEALDETVECDGDDVSKSVIRRHRLHPFSLDYFKGDKRLFSYSKTQAAAGGIFQKSRKQSVPFVIEPLPRIESSAVSLIELLHFWSHPCKAFIEKRLEMKLRVREDRSDDDEPFSLDNLDEYKIREMLLKAELDPAQLANLRGAGATNWLHAEGRLPLGATGAAIVSDLQLSVREFIGRLPPEYPGERFAFECVFPTVKLHGELKRLLPSGLFFVAAKKEPNAKDLIKAWVEHLVLCATATEHGRNCVTTYYALEKTVQFEPVTNAMEELESLLKVREDGMCAPLVFFTRSSKAFVKAMNKGSTQMQAMDAARNKWMPVESAFSGKPESEDPYNTLCFRHADPLELDDFKMLANSVFGPLLKHLKTGGGEND